jgi:CDP-diacylglycerol--glycerol-3-phosphate 3-phosphatidyltransferase
MNLPNILTLVRIFFIPLLVAALVQQNYTVNVFGTVVTNEYIALAIFLVAGATDLVDGYLARRWRQVTTVGTLLDPIADKLLVSAALISLVEVQVLEAWMAILIIGREFAISGLRSIAAAEGYVIKANDLGKLKLVTQVIALSMLMLSIRWPAMRMPAAIAMWLVVTFSIFSAVVYFRKFWHQIDDAVKQRSRRDFLRP